MRLTLLPDRLALVVEDNGQGFDPAAQAGRGQSAQDRQATGHFGLLGLAERARLLGGTLKLETGPGEGARVEVVVPIE